MSSIINVDFVYEKESDIERIARSIRTLHEQRSDSEVLGSDLRHPDHFNVKSVGKIGTIDWDFYPYSEDDEDRFTTVPELPTVEALVSGVPLDTDDEFDPAMILDVVRQTYADEKQPAYVFGLDEGHAEIIGDDGPESRAVTAKTLENGQINAVSWLMLFPPNLVASYGQEFLLDAPAWRTEELTDGAILIVACSDPTDFGALNGSLPDLKTYFGTEHPHL